MRRVLAHPLWRSLRLRLTLWYVALLAVVLLAFSVILYARLQTTLEDTLDETLNSREAVLASAITAVNGAPRLGAVPLPSERNKGEQFMRLYDASGTLVIDDTAGGIAIPPLPTDVAAAQRGISTARSVTTADGPFRVLTMPVSSPVRGVLQVGISEDSIREATSALAAILVTLVPLILLVASGGGLFLAGRSLAPVDRMIRAARRIEATDLHARLPEPASRDEIGRLARTLNALIARLEAAFARQRQFTADASHELRTPLTIMRGELDVTLRRERSAAEYRETLTGMREEVNRLQDLVANLLLIARTDERAPLPTTVVDLAVVAAAVETQLQPLARARCQTLTLEVIPALVRGVASDLERLIRNLVENAIRYTPEAGTITVNVCRDARNVLLRVEDTGPGIAPEMLPHLFERFTRADTSRNRAAGGTGLGLAIAQSIAHRHGGAITVVSRIGQGTTFTFTVPHVNDAGMPRVIGSATNPHVGNS